VLVAVWLMRGRLQAATAFRGAGDSSLRAQFCRWTLALLPLGLGMWASHLVFHLVTAAGALSPTLRQVVKDLHLDHGRLGDAFSWSAGPSLLDPQSLLQLQFGVLDAGLLFALYIGWRMVRSTPIAKPSLSDSRCFSPPSRLTAPSIYRSLATLAPWAAVVLGLYAVGVWVLLEPMQMRGMMGM
jgi:hypothetical protein